MPLNEVLAARNAIGPIPKQSVLGWMAEMALDVRGGVYRLTRSDWNRIEPELTMQEQCSFMANYLLECLAADPTSSEFVHSGFEAGYELAAWLKHLNRMSCDESVAKDVIAGVAAQLTASYRQADRRSRNRIETAALEHIFEEPSLRCYFDEWRDDPELQESYKYAVAWADAHPTA